jgi:hypothetical protein
VQLPGGRWISEKDPGYPYLAVAFQALGLIRLAPLFYGALACLGLYFGGRRWVGRFGGAAAVGLYCSSGTLQAARFYVPTLGAISLLGAWLPVRVPRRQPFVAVTTLAVVAVLFGLGGWAFHDMYQFPFGRQLVVVHGPGGTVELKPGPGVRIGGPGRVAPGGPGRAVHVGPSGGPSVRPAS